MTTPDPTSRPQNAAIAGSAAVLQTTNPYTLAIDPTAQTEPLTEGQKIVADWETGRIGPEPADLARIIDMALIEAWDRGKESV